MLAEEQGANHVQLRQLANANAKQKAKVADRFGRGPHNIKVDKTLH